VSRRQVTQFLFGGGGRLFNGHVDLWVRYFLHQCLGLITSMRLFIYKYKYNLTTMTKIFPIFQSHIKELFTSPVKGRIFRNPVLMYLN
jgi:hypothetical protein